MSSSTAMETPTCFQFKASFSPCTILQLKNYDLQLLEQQIRQTIARAPNIFLGSPVIIDLEKLPAIQEIDFGQLKNILIKVGLVPMGVRGTSLEQETQALAAHLPLANIGKRATSLQMLNEDEKTEHSFLDDTSIVDDISLKLGNDQSVPHSFAPNNNEVSRETSKNTGNESKPGSAQSTRVKEEYLETVNNPIRIDKPHQTKIVTHPIRSGMQVYAKDGDLIVVGQVSSGAELLSDGHIHVYGPLRGRALAGLLGNIQARIFCRTLEAELVSIAGFYLTKEDMQVLPAHNGMIQIYLENEQVKIEAL